jgi:hypothetical protein
VTDLSTIVEAVDRHLADIGQRELVSSAEVADWLLDIRLHLVPVSSDASVLADASTMA